MQVNVFVLSSFDLQDKNFFETKNLIFFLYIYLYQKYTSLNNFLSYIC